MWTKITLFIEGVWYVPVDIVKPVAVFLEPFPVFIESHLPSIKGTLFFSSHSEEWLKQMGLCLVIFNPKIPKTDLKPKFKRYTRNDPLNLKSECGYSIDWTKLR